MQSLIKTYLTHNNYISKINEFEDVFLSHPNYPSLLAVTDGLTTANIENIAAKVPFKHFSELPITFIAELGSNDDKEFYFVEKNHVVKIAKRINILYSTNNQKPYICRIDHQP